MSHTPRTPQGASFWDKNKNLLLRVVLCLLLATATVLTVWYSARMPATITPDNGDADQTQSNDPLPTPDEQLPTDQPWTSTRLHVDTDGAGISLDAFLASCPTFDAKDAVMVTGGYEPSTVLKRIALPESITTSASLSTRAAQQITREWRAESWGTTFETVVTETTQDRPAVETVSGYLVCDRGDGTYDLLDTTGSVVFSSLSFDAVTPTSLSDAAGNPLFLENGGYTVLIDGARIAYDAKGVNMANRSTCLGTTGDVGNENIRIYEANGRYGYQTNDGARLTDAVYTRAFAFSEGLALAMDETALYVLDTTGQCLYTAPYTVSSDLEGSASLLLPDTEGLESLGFFYFDHGLMRIRQRISYTPQEGYYYNNYYVFDADVLLDAYGNVTEMPNGYELVSYHDGIRILRHVQTGAVGLADHLGQWITPPAFQDATPCVQGLTPVKYNDKWGVVDQNGQFVMPATFDLPPTILGGVIAAYSSQSGWMAFALAQS